MFVKTKQTRHISRPHPGGGLKSAGIALGEKQRRLVRYHAVGRIPFPPENGFSSVTCHCMILKDCSLTRAMLVIIC